MHELFISELTDEKQDVELYKNAGKSFKNALSVVKKHSYINFKNYEYFYQLTYRYAYDIRNMLNRTYLDFMYFVTRNGELFVDKDNMIVNNAEESLKDFMYQGDISLMLKRRAALIGILDLLSSSAKPGKFAM